MNALETAPEPGETLDRLAAEWWIFQLERGHRYSTDDVLVAWTACNALPGARRVLDLGAGVGSVGLMTLLGVATDARLTSIEVQQRSAALMRKTITANDLVDRVQVHCGDLREPNLLEAGERFELIVANPPYLPVGDALVSPHPQRAAARLELHGDVADFCRVAAARLEPDGRFCFCHAAADPRPEPAVIEAGLCVLARRPVVFREGQKPAIALYVCGREGPRCDPTTLTVRGRNGERTEEFRAVRRAMLIEA
ncbi:MAG: methyltransferase [Deltaproteobacteria bacterium]|nr:methyltransferase [Deltaproteobacteria bacterium]